jgi:hypothetical protein
MHRSNELPQAPPARGRVRRVAAIAAISTALWSATVGTVAWAADRSSDEPQMTRLEQRAYARWWDGQVSSGGLAFADVPYEALADAAEQAWADGASRKALSAVLFSDAGRNLLAGNAAAGEGEPSPYVPYFRNNPSQLEPLGEYLHENQAYVAGPGGTQDELFDRFPGLRESYLASLGLVEVAGRIVDPRAPYLTPYMASLRLGPPQALPQPEASVDVDTP